jgi:hypothetical protein
VFISENLWLDPFSNQRSSAQSAAKRVYAKQKGGPQAASSKQTKTNP